MPRDAASVLSFLGRSESKPLPMGKRMLTMTEQRAGITASTYTVSGLVTVLAGIVVAVVFALQPWRTCPEDDVAAGCSALPQDVAGVMLGLVVLGGGLVLLLVGAQKRRQE